MALSSDVFGPAIKVQRRVKNPLDKCTIVSVFPNSIIDYKPTAFPSTHRIEGAADNDFSITVVEAAGWFKEMDEGQPWLEIPIASTDVARAFIQDYVNALPEFVPDVAAPGLFYVLGSYNKETIKKYVDPVSGETFTQMLERAKARQKNWFLRIVQMSDKDWARTNGNPRSIGDTARMAAHKLGIEDKPWLKDFQAAARVNCPACGFSVNPDFPVCSNCRAIVNPARAKELNISFAS